MRLVLIGYRCTGKTSVGKRVAERLGLPFYDTDELVQQGVGKSIRELVAASGWGEFRRLEREVIQGLPQGEGVVAAGGGAVLDPRNRVALKEKGVCIWLVADVGTIVARMKRDEKSGEQRPALTGANLEAETTDLLAARRPFYASLADFTLDTTEKSIDAIAEEVCQIMAVYQRSRSESASF